MKEQEEKDEEEEEEDGLESLHRFIDSFIQSHETSSASLATGTSTPNWFVQESVPAVSFSPFLPSIGLPSAYPAAAYNIVSEQTPNPAFDQAGLHHNLSCVSHVSPASLYSLQLPPAIPSSGMLFFPAASTAAATVSSNSSSSSESSSIATSFSCVPVSLPQDPDLLSPYQTLLRQQLEFFEADYDDVAVVQGRTKPVSLHQIGIRCRHCAHQNAEQRTIGSPYYPARLDSIYQSGQNVAKHHFAVNRCPSIPPEIQQLLNELAQKGKKGKSLKGRGKEYWAEGARELGVVERGGRLEFEDEGILKQESV